MAAENYIKIYLFIGILKSLSNEVLRDEIESEDNRNQSKIYKWEI